MKLKPPACKQLLQLLIAMLIVFSNITQQAWAQDKKKKKKPSYELGLGIGGSYDDNILKYSDKYLNRFLNNEDEGRFHIETYDDFIIYTSAGITGTYYWFGKQKTLINADYSRRTYAVNGIKSWDYFSAGIRQYLPGRISFKFLYSYIPDFYVRHFRDDVWVDVYGYEPNTFTPYAFSKDNYGFYIQKYFWKSSRIKFSFYWAQYFHNKHYTEYDSDNLYYRIQLYQELTDDLRFEIGYEYITSDAKGYDAAYETPETTDGPDATYDEDVLQIGLRWQPPRIKKHYHEFYVSADYSSRYYSSSHPVEIDALHAGRVDRVIHLELDYRYKINKHFDIKAFFDWYGRDTETTSDVNSEYVSDEKDYIQHIYGLQLDYSLDF
ncbi:MAG: hypothetical protein KDC05_00790 [Bacteroidales bacterium]|nr:hypothetical protein [Bacteroidales bacterium]